MRSGFQACSRVFAICALLTLSACDDDDDGVVLPVPPGPNPARQIAVGEPLPGIQLAITQLTGGSQGGTFRAGDVITVRYTAKTADGSFLDVSSLDGGSIYVSGPTFNYQRVIAEQTDLRSASVYEGDGVWVYRFASPIPATYLAPLNDSASFTDDELTGQALLAGTYTIGMQFDATYTDSNLREYVDAGTLAADFLVGGAATAAPRAAVQNANCNNCHLELRAHGGKAKDVRLCVLCHTAGAEDSNAGGATPGTSIEFKVMIHKIHNGAHLPSVLGVSTAASGSRLYPGDPGAVAPRPLEYADDDGAVVDYSEVGFPMMPSAYVAYTYNQTGTTYTGTRGNGPMPRDVGYSGLSLANKLLEDKIRTGVVSCASCHGDPDGSDPLTPPAQGDLAYTQPTRRACGSCHDDIDWTLPYRANNIEMVPQLNDSECVQCHPVSGNTLSTVDAHRHPYTNPNANTGVNVTITGVGGAASGNHQAGEPIQVTFDVKDDAGTDLQVHQTTRFQAIAVGPTSNPQWVLPNADLFDMTLRKMTGFVGNGTASTPVVSSAAVAQTIAVVFTSATAFDLVGSVTAPVIGQTIGAASGAQASVDYAGVQFLLTQGSTAFANHDRFYFEVVPTAPSYSVTIPRNLTFERLGAASGAAQSLPAGNLPIYWGRQTVFERTALVGAATTTGADAVAMQRYLVIDQATFGGVAVGDRVVIGAGATEEYAQVSYIQTTDARTGADLGPNDRFFFNFHLRYDHGSGTPVQEVTLTTKKEGRDYTLATTNATAIDLLAGQFGAGNPIVMSYRSHARFGWYRAPGEPLHAVYTPATGDSDDLGAEVGDWTGLPLVDGTYTVGIWTHKDFTVTPLDQVTTTESETNLATDNTTYRMISPPATLDFLFGAAASIAPRQLIDEASCTRCHGEILAHGNGRRGVATCVLCHASPGMEDAPLYNFNGWYIGQTPGVTMDFRTMLHKIHMGRELTNAADYVVNGIYLGVPYPVDFAHAGFPQMPGGASNCATCHGADSDTWKAPAWRDHPTANAGPVRTWAVVCGSCHDSDPVQAHMAANTSSFGYESCEVCHGAGSGVSVEKVHRAR
jgi:hypothetical protein